MEAIRYEEANIDKRIIRAVTENGYEEMTPIQQRAIPALLEGKDIIGQAQTGTGKTAAFGIPMVEMADPEDPQVQGIVLCPTRELAIQAAEEIRKFAKYMQGIKVLPIYGGQDIEKQIRSLRGQVAIVVGTPGRVMDHMRRHTLKLGGIKMVVLDEADEMLNMGFIDDIEEILSSIPENHQTALFSATMPDEILRIAAKYQKDAETIQVERKELTIPLVKQYYYEVLRQNKEEAVCRLLDYYNPKLSLIFCNTKYMVDTLTENLKGRGYFAEGLHGDLSQAQRDKVMNAFRQGTTEILVATDVAARGIDVDNVEAVFNFDIPQDVEYYVHRIGRTGRAGRKGRSFTMVVGREIYRIRDIERVCNTKINARMLPSVADITAAKSKQVFDKVLEIMSTSDLTELTNIVQEKINDEDITAMELCAGFLRMYLGDDKEDIPAENYIEAQKKRRSQKDKDRLRDNRDRKRFREKQLEEIFSESEKRGRKDKKDKRDKHDRHDRKREDGRDSRREDKYGSKRDSKRDSKREDKYGSKRASKHDGRSESRHDRRKAEKPSFVKDVNKSGKAKKIKKL